MISLMHSLEKLEIFNSALKKIGKQIEERFLW